MTRLSRSPIRIPSSEYARGGDPLLDGLVRAYGGAFAAYARDELGFVTEMTYVLLSSEVSGKWDWGEGGGRSNASASDDLQALLAYNPSFRLHDHPRLQRHGHALRGEPLRARPPAEYRRPGARAAQASIAAGTCITSTRSPAKRSARTPRRSIRSLDVGCIDRPFPGKSPYRLPFSLHLLRPQPARAHNAVLQPGCHSWPAHAKRPAGVVRSWEIVG